MALPKNIVDLDPVDFCGKQIESFAEAFWTKTFNNPALGELLTIIPGVKAKQQVVVLGLIGMVGKTMQTIQCAPPVSELTIPSVQKFYEPGYVEDRFTECWKNLLEKFTVWGLKVGIQKPDLTGTDFADFLEAQVIDALIESVYRIVWFGEKDAKTLTAGGHFKDTLDLAYVNTIDGLWKQFFAIAAANPAQRVTIARNQGATFAAQKFTPQDVTDQVVTGILESMLEGRDDRFAEDANAIFYVTRSVADQYKKERRKFTNIDVAYTRTETGWDTLEFDGVTLYVLKFEDRMIKDLQSSATVAYLPHRIYLANKENLHLATEEENALSQINSFYDQKDKQYYIDLLYSLDALIIEDYKLMVAY
jgi:hypothetical protein